MTQSSSIPWLRATDVLTIGMGGSLLVCNCCVNIGDRLIGTGQIGFVDDDDIGDFQDAGFFPLQFVAGLRLQHEHDDVGHPPDRRIALAGADGFNEDAVKPKRFIRSSMSSMFGAMPCWPDGVARLRMKTRSDSESPAMRQRSPSSAPPVTGLSGSQARTPTRSPRSAN